jgi:hypothetical protein
VFSAGSVSPSRKPAAVSEKPGVGVPWSAICGITTGLPAASGLGDGPAAGLVAGLAAGLAAAAADGLGSALPAADGDALTAGLGAAVGATVAGGAGAVVGAEGAALVQASTNTRQTGPIMWGSRIRSPSCASEVTCERRTLQGLSVGQAPNVHRHLPAVANRHRAPDDYLPRVLHGG